MIGTIQSINNLLILPNQLLENEFPKINQEIGIFNSMCLVLQTVIVCYYFHFDIKKD